MKVLDAYTNNFQTETSSLFTFFIGSNFTFETYCVMLNELLFEVCKAKISLALGPGGPQQKVSSD